MSFGFSTDLGNKKRPICLDDSLDYLKDIEVVLQPKFLPSKERLTQAEPRRGFWSGNEDYSILSSNFLR